MKIICNVEAHSKPVVGEMRSVHLAQRFMIYAVYIDENARTDEAKDVMKALGKRGQSFEERKKLLEDAMTKASLQECAFIDFLRREDALFAFQNDLQAMCGPRQGELAKKLAEIPDAQKQVKAREAHFDANLKTAEAKRLFAVLRDSAKPLDERAAAAEAAAVESQTSFTGCEHLEAVKRAHLESKASEE